MIDQFNSVFTVGSIEDGNFRLLPFWCGKGTFFYILFKSQLLIYIYYLLKAGIINIIVNIS